MNVFNVAIIAKEVIEGHILPFLQLNDILRLRRVCKSTRAMADNYLSLQNNLFKKEIDIEVEGEERSFRQFFNLGFSPSAVHIKNKDVNSLGSDDVREFVEKYADKIANLSVDVFDCCVTSKELKFYESFPNLKCVHLQRVSLMWLDKGRPFKFPVTFRNLQKLIVDEVIGPVMCPDENPIYRYLSKLYRFCNKVEFLKHPKFLIKNETEGGYEYLNDQFLGVIRDLILTRSRCTEKDGSNLKIYDVKNFKYEGSDPGDAVPFFDLCRLCTKNDVKLAHVDTNFLFGWNYDPFRDTIMEEIEELVTPFQSVGNMHWLMFWSEAKYLEEIRIDSVARCSIADMLNCHPDWPLKKLSMVIDSFETETPELSEMMATPGDTDYFIESLLGEDTKDKLEELRLEFDSKVETEQPYFKKLERRARYPIPRAAGIIEICPNLKKIELKNWPGTNKALLKIWKAFSGQLEEILLDDCLEVGNVTFVGTDTGKPIFLQMPRLKKLTLRNFDKMPKITDLTFDMVFRHLQLTQFILHSSSPIKSVTVKGIRNLLTGDFAKSIEKFPFDQWSLAKMRVEDFRQLESEFRSSQMI